VRGVAEGFAFEVFVDINDWRWGDIDASLGILFENHSGDFSELADADEAVDFGNGIHQFLAVALGEAAGDVKFFGRTGLSFALGQLDDGVDRLGFGRCDKAAGCNDGGVERLAVVGEDNFAAGLLDHAGEIFIIDGIFIATEGDDADPQRGLRF